MKSIIGFIFLIVLVYVFIFKDGEPVHDFITGILDKLNDLIFERGK